MLSGGLLGSAFEFVLLVFLFQSSFAVLSVILVFRCVS